MHKSVIVTLLIVVALASPAGADTCSTSHAWENLRAAWQQSWTYPLSLPAYEQAEAASAVAHLPLPSLRALQTIHHGRVGSVVAALLGALVLLAALPGIRRRGWVAPAMAVCLGASSLMLEQRMDAPLWLIHTAEPLRTAATGSSLAVGSAIRGAVGECSSGPTPGFCLWHGVDGARGWISQEALIPLEGSCGEP